MIGAIGLGRESFSVYGGIASSEDSVIDWSALIYELIVENNPQIISDDYNTGEVGVHKKDNNNWGFSSIVALMPA